MALVRTGDRMRLDLRKREVIVRLSDEELARRREEIDAQGGYAYPASQTPWQQIQRALIGQFDTGAILEGSEEYQRIAQTRGLPRDSH